jgi:hypothetical protein
MRSKPPLVPAALFLFALAVVPARAQAQNLAEMWQITPKAGVEVGFQEAFKAHMDFRVAHGETWIWQTWEIVVGEDVGDFLIVSFDHSWADWDAYEVGDFMQVAGAHFGATVSPLVEDAANMIFQGDSTLSKMPTDPAYEPSLVNTMAFSLAPGKFMAFNGAMAQLHAAIVEADMPFFYLSSAPVVGGDDSDFTMAFIGESWADFTDPDPDLMQVMAEKYGEEEAMAIWTTLDESVAGIQSSMLRLRPDLSNLPEI